MRFCILPPAIGSSVWKRTLSWVLAALSGRGDSLLISSSQAILRHPLLSGTCFGRGLVGSAEPDPERAGRKVSAQPSFTAWLLKSTGDSAMKKSRALD